MVDSPTFRHIEGAFHLENIVLVKPCYLKNGARRIGAAAPNLLLNLVHERTQAPHVGHEDGQPDAIGKASALRFSDRLHVQERLPDSRFVTVDEGVIRRINAAHSSHEYEIAGARTEAPCAG